MLIFLCLGRARGVRFVERTGSPELVEEYVPGENRATKLVNSRANYKGCAYVDACL